MQPARITCNGANIGPFAMPPFQLRPGDLLCLHLPRLEHEKDEALLLRGLTGEQPVCGLHVSSYVVAVQPAAPRRWLLRLLGQPTLAAWLAKKSGISIANAAQQVEAFRQPSTMKLDRVARTPRLLLALLAAWNQGAEAIIFSLVGLDPLGQEVLAGAVQDHLAACPAILLSYPFTTNGEVKRFCPAGAQCVELRRGAAA